MSQRCRLLRPTRRRAKARSRRRLRYSRHASSRPSTPRSRGRPASRSPLLLLSRRFLQLFRRPPRPSPRHSGARAPRGRPQALSASRGREPGGKAGYADADVLDPAPRRAHSKVDAFYKPPEPRRFRRRFAGVGGAEPDLKPRPDPYAGLHKLLSSPRSGLLHSAPNMPHISSRPADRSNEPRGTAHARPLGVLTHSMYPLSASALKTSPTTWHGTFALFANFSQRRGYAAQDAAGAAPVHVPPSIPIFIACGGFQKQRKKVGLRKLVH